MDFGAVEVISLVNKALDYYPFSCGANQSLGLALGVMKRLHPGKNWNSVDKGEFGGLVSAALAGDFVKIQASLSNEEVVDLLLTKYSPLVSLESVIESMSADQKDIWDVWNKHGVSIGKEEKLRAAQNILNDKKPDPPSNPRVLVKRDINAVDISKDVYRVPKKSKLNEEAGNSAMLSKMSGVCLNNMIMTGVFPYNNDRGFAL